MTREDFIKKCTLMGLGLALAPSILSSCKKEEFIVQFSGKVLIIGAGSAGLMAGHLLHQHGIDFEIIEASSIFGGRVKKNDSFASFPIDMGAEWVHDDPDVFSRMMRNDQTIGSIELVPYNPQTIKTWQNGRLTNLNVGEAVYGEYKFKNQTWYDFFDQHIVPDIQNKITFNSPVTQIDYNGDKILLSDENGNSFEGDKVVVTVPTTILQSNMITFSPEIPQTRINALQKASMPDGIKVFMKFSQRFYPDLLIYNAESSQSNGELLYYDAAFRKESSENENVLALFTVGQNASQFTDIATNDALIEYILNQLDEVFDDQASMYYLDHVVQNWSKEPFILGSYTYLESNDETIATLRENINEKVYFAGEALSLDASATVPGAGLSGIEVVENILQGG